MDALIKWSAALYVIDLLFVILAAACVGGIIVWVVRRCRRNEKKQ